VIIAENITFEYPGTLALDDVSFSVAAGTITALVGPNGAGKTTLLRCLAALELMDSGRVVIDGLDVSEDPRECHKRLGYLSDFFGLYDDLTVRQCLTYHASIHGLDPAGQPAAVDRAIERMELGPLLHKKAGTLSRGQRQRLGVAQAIVHDPKVLLLDEPASGLDPEARWKLSSLITAMARDGMTLIVSSHILAELEDYSTDVMIVRGGSLVMHKPLSEAARDMTAGAAGLQTCMRIELARPEPSIERVLAGFADASNVVVHGTGVSLFIPATAEHKTALLRHLVEAALPVVSFTEDKSRVQDVYLSLLGSERAPADVPAEQEEGRLDG